MGDLAQHGSLATVTVDTPLGPVDLIAPPAIVDGDRPAPGRVPALGEHDDTIRTEFAAKDGASLGGTNAA